MNVKKQKTLLFFLFSFSIYCAITIGMSWDEGFHLRQGKIALEYLFSLGLIDEDLPYREYYSPIYWSFQYILTKIFPVKYTVEISHLSNLLFSVSTIFGAGKIGKELFNKKVGKIIFLILFFYPPFFGQMSFNPKDTILAFSHIWIAYLIIRYLKKQHIENKKNGYLIHLGLLAALSTGIQLVFLGSIIPLFLFLLVEIFIFKKIITTNFSIKKFLIDLIKCFLLFYIVLILFWIDTHPNIFILPYKFITETFSSVYLTGWPTVLLNEKYYLSIDVPVFYLILNIIFKTPEYLLILYIIFIILLFSSKKFFNEEFQHFNYKLSLLLLILIFPNTLLIFAPYPVYDGIRLFLWFLPYLCIIPGITIYYLLENSKLLKVQVALLSLLIFIIYFLYNFFAITPYHYTYLNVLSGKNEYRYKKFENDYWGSSIKELIKYTNLKKDKNFLFATCGVNPNIIKYYLKKNGYYKFKFVNPEKSDYIIMTNRTVLINIKDKPIEITNCFNMFRGKDFSKVERNNLSLSVVRDIN